MRKVLKLTTVFAATLTVGGAASANSDDQGYLYTYYSDTFKTEVVGYAGKYCGGEVYGNGYPTAFWDVEYTEC
jgi:hypothetical protein